MFNKVVAVLTTFFFFSNFALAVPLEQPFVNGAPVSTANPMPVTVGGGGSSSTITSPVGAGTATAAVRTTEASDSPLLGRLPAALGSGGGLKIDGSGTALPVSGTITANPGAATTGGATTYSLIAANTTNSTLISAGGHQTYGVTVFNNSSTIAYLKIYDKATAPTCNSDTPVQRYMVPGNSGGSGFIVPVSIGFPVILGLGFCLTGGIADNDNTAVAASAYLVNILYK